MQTKSFKFKFTTLLLEFKIKLYLCTNWTKLSYKLVNKAGLGTEIESAICFDSDLLNHELIEKRTNRFQAYLIAIFVTGKIVFSTEIRVVYDATSA